MKIEQPSDKKINETLASYEWIKGQYQVTDNYIGVGRGEYGEYITSQALYTKSFDSLLPIIENLKSKGVDIGIEITFMKCRVVLSKVVGRYEGLDIEEEGDDLLSTACKAVYRAIEHLKEPII